MRKQNENDENSQRNSKSIKGKNFNRKKAINNFTKKKKNKC